jgi:hypothetical protein
MLSGSQQLLPDYFPGVTKSCQDVGEKFFECFTTNAVKKEENDTTSGVNAVVTCTKELEAYKSCMEKMLPKIELKKFRVRGLELFTK